MQSFVEFIAESFDSDVPVNWKRKSLSRAVAAFQVNSIVVEVDFEQREPAAVVFIAKDEDRAGIYSAYLRRERARLDELGYHIEGPHTVDPYTEWTLRRAKPSGWKE